MRKIQMTQTTDLKHATAFFAPRETFRKFLLPLLLGGLLLAGMQGAQAVTDVIPATGTWTAPAGVTSVDVEVWGGGGAGGGNPTTTDGGGGGGGGAYSKTTAIPVVPGTIYTVTVGTGGIGVAGGNGGVGGDSWFNSAATIMAKGGAGGAVPVGGAGGLGGAGGAAAAGVGAIKFSGGNGGTGRNSNTGRGAPGGSSAGTAANGTSGPVTWATCTAAAAPAGGGIGGNGGCANSVSGLAPASGIGGGGGGGAERSTSGGNGAPGLVTITYTPGGGGAVPVTYYHDTTNGVNIGFDGTTNVTGADQNIPPVITASLNPVNTCPVTSARSRNHPVGAYTHSRWYLNSDYAVATNIGANPTGSASLRGGAVTDTVIVSLYDYEPVTGVKVLIGSSAPITLTGGATTTTYTYAISSPLYIMPAAHRLMLEYNFNQSVATDRARVYCSATASFITVTESPAAVVPVAEYHMDEASWNGTANEVADNSVNALHGTAFLGATTAPAKLCNGANLAANYVQVADNPLLDLPTALTVTAWLKPARWGGAPGKDALMTFLSKDTNYEAHINATGNVFWWWGTGSFASTATVPIGAWTHVALVYASGSQTIYINGAASGTAAFAGALPVNAMPLQIGDDQAFGGGTRRFDGMIDEVKIFNTALTPTEISTGYANENAGNNWDGSARTCVSLIDHVAVTAPANAMAFSATPVELAPHTAAHGALTGMTINLSTDTGLGDWSIGTGTGTLTPGPANSGQANYVFDALESSAILYFTYQTAGTVTINVTDAGGADMLLNTPVGEKANTIVYALPDYVFTDSACVHNIAFGAPGQTCAVLNWSPQVAGIDFSGIYLTALSAGVPTRFHPTQPRTRDMQFGLSCHNPVADAGIQAVFSTVTLPLCEANGATPASWSATTLTASFPGGVPSAGPYTFNYADVGNVELWTRDSAATTKVGASGIFTVAPHHFGFSGVTAVPALPFKAGNDFSATVTAYNGLAIPTTTPNFGQETPTAESVTLSFSKCQPTGTNSDPGTFSGTVGAFSGGAASSANLNWDEVGNGDLIATNDTYLGSTISATGNTGTGGTVCNGAGNVGPFVPDHFNTVVTAPMVCPGALTCPAGGLAYSGQAFTVNVSAMNAADVVTKNYDGTANTTPNFAKQVTLTAWDALGSITTQNPPSGDPGALSNGIVPAASFTQGKTETGTPATPYYRFATVPTAPTDIYIRAADADASSLRAVPASSIEGGAKVVNGRIMISNAHGSELLKLSIPVKAQYWNGTTYLNSATDSASSFVAATPPAASEIGFANFLKNLATIAVTGTPKTVTLTNGAGNFQLAAPGAGNDGSVDMTLPAVTGIACDVVPTPAGCYLLGNTARATFGVYKGDKAFIYLREAY
ncbi:MAG: LamG domain-containing protein [Nitrosomonadales bacterium]|nr:LamG domain-containing protein [Nitrosomonadales bacterium]